jgi:hypothetical protein
MRRGTTSPHRQGGRSRFTMVWLFGRTPPNGTECGHCSKRSSGLRGAVRYKATILSKSSQRASSASKSTDEGTPGLVEETDDRPKSKKVERAKGLDKASDAYLLRSTRDTVVRADTVPLCIALWRLRIWFGQGWDRGMWGGWEKPARTPEERTKQGSSTSVANDPSSRTVILFRK